MVSSPCNGVCRIIEEVGKEAKCISCKRTYDDLAQWLYLSEEARQARMKQLCIQRIKNSKDIDDEQ